MPVICIFFKIAIFKKNTYFVLVAITLNIKLDYIFFRDKKVSNFKSKLNQVQRKNKCNVPNLKHFQK